MDLDELEKETGVKVADDRQTLTEFSRDTSLFQVTPQAVVFPASGKDVEALVAYVNKHKKNNPDLSLTGRSAGTDMTGGPLNESIIVSCTETLDDIKKIEEDRAVIQPGVYYREFEKELLPKHLTMPVYPASKSIAALGGMVMNNCGGEKTLRYGQMRDYVNSVSMVLADGNEYTFEPISEEELAEKKTQDNFEGEVYRKIHKLLEKNYELIQDAEPDTSKNSAGYALWEIWDKESGVFDLSQLFVGSQGTLGVMTEAEVKLQKEKPHNRLISVFFNDWKAIPKLVNKLLKHDPESLEVFDKETLKLGLRFMPEIAKKAGQSFLSFAFQFLPEAWIGVKMGGLPGLVLLVELAEETEEKLNKKTKAVEDILSGSSVHSRTLYAEKEQEKYWVMRRQSFNLLRQHVKGKHTAPFVDDFCIQLEDVPEFLPQARQLLERNGISVNITGHAGNGNFHIIPLMDLSKEAEREKIPKVAKEFYDLVLEYDGTITAEHNDGIIRTPFLEQMYGGKVYGLFKKVKDILDPDNIFNPGKKVGGTLAYAAEHISPKEDN